MNKSIASVVSTSLVALALSISAALAANEEIPTTFTYTDPSATSVGVAGEFSNWTIQPMSKDSSGTWTKTLYLKPGYYGYKLIVNGEWQFDPKNPARKMVNDIENSAISVGGVQAPSGGALASAPGKTSTTFSYVNPSAKSVHVAGEFNNWLDNVDGKVTGKTEWMMQNDGAGNWKYTAQLAPGRYKFKYVIDGGEKWEQDPTLPASADGNSIIEVKAAGAVSAAAATPPPTAAPQGSVNVGFSYADPNAKAVSVAGEFNKWSATANPLKKDASGIWSATIPLKPGKYQYKFVVDGTWKEDPTNPENVDDGLGGKNSVKIVTP